MRPPRLQQWAGPTPQWGSFLFFLGILATNMGCYFFTVFQIRKSIDPERGQSVKKTNPADFHRNRKECSIQPVPPQSQTSIVFRTNHYDITIMATRERGEEQRKSRTI